MSYPFASLADNLAAFCAGLRRDRGFHIGPGELTDAARALDLVDIADERAVRNTLRPILSGSADDVSVFDEAFTAFFLPQPVGEPQAGMPSRERALGGGDTTERAHRHGDPPPDDERPGDDAAGLESVAMPLEGEASDVPDARSAARATYSPVEVPATEVPDRADLDTEWIDTARRLVRRVHLGWSRRWRPARRGRRFDARRTLRAAVQTGGEALAPRWQSRQRRAPRFVVLIDGSRSMGAHALTGLRIGAALAAVTRRAEVFTFSTSLQRVTERVRRGAEEARDTTWNQRAWGGGTAIGPCLRTFLRRFGHASLGPDTVVMLCSDGLDVGDAETLRGAMRDLDRRSAGIVWLNPLRDTGGYEPTARGMRAALPYVSTFSSANDLPGFERLTRTIRLRP